ncbi:hypothetical protein H4R35_002281, partial [Dimargaris xerosporica]
SPTNSMVSTTSKPAVSANSSTASKIPLWRSGFGPEWIAIFIYTSLAWTLSSTSGMQMGFVFTYGFTITTITIPNPCITI